MCMIPQLVEYEAVPYAQALAPHVGAPAREAAAPSFAAAVDAHTVAAAHT